MEWIFIGEYSSMGVGYLEYVSKDGKQGMQVWHDGYVEIYDLDD